MVTTRSEGTPYRTVFTVGGHEANSDASKEKGGQGAGFGPHALLEASVACCVNIWLRMVADQRQIPLSAVTVQVRLNRKVPGETIFQYAVQLQGNLSESQRFELQQQAVSCPVSRTLLKRVSFQLVEMEDMA